MKISCLQFSKSVWEFTNILFKAKILFLEVSRTRNTKENPPVNEQVVNCYYHYYLIEITNHQVQKKGTAVV